MHIYTIINESFESILYVNTDLILFSNNEQFWLQSLELSFNSPFKIENAITVVQKLHTIATPQSEMLLYYCDQLQ